MKHLYKLLIVLGLFTTVFSKDLWWNVSESDWWPATFSRDNSSILERKDNSIIINAVDRLIQLDPLGNTIWHKRTTKDKYLPTDWPTSIMINDVKDNSRNNLFVIGKDSTSATIIQEVDNKGNVTWHKSYSGNVQYFQNVNSDLVICDYNFTNSWIHSINSEGDTLWSVTINDDFQKPYSLNLTETLDKNIAVVELFTRDNVHYVRVLKISNEGDILLNKTHSNNSSFILKNTQIIESLDKSLSIAGESDSGIGLLKFDNNGDMVWEKQYLTNIKTNLDQILQNSDSTVYLLGSTKSNPWDAGDLYLLAINNEGDTDWTKTINPGHPYDNEDTLHMSGTILETNDGNLLLSAFGRAVLGEYNAPYLYKYDGDGSLLWSERPTGGRFVEYKSLIETDDNNLLLSLSIGKEFGINLWELVKLNPNGNTLWSTTKGSSIWGPKLLKGKDKSFLYAYEYNNMETRVGAFPAVQYATPQKPLILNVAQADSNSTNNTFTLLTGPEGMTIDPIGQITWTPPADSTFMSHVTFTRTSNDTPETLWFDVWANWYEGAIATSIIQNSDINKNKSFIKPHIFKQNNVIQINANTHIEKLQLFDLKGRLLREKYETKLTNSAIINTKSLVNGIYIIKVSTLKGVSCHRISLY